MRHAHGRSAPTPRASCFPRSLTPRRSFLVVLRPTSPGTEPCALAVRDYCHPTKSLSIKINAFVASTGERALFSPDLYYSVRCPSDDGPPHSHIRRSRIPPTSTVPEDQQRVPHARVLHAHGYAARSVHKGRRCFLADQGVSSEALMQLSGHRNATTLFRYIGRQAIHARNLVNEVTSAGGSIDPLPPTTHHDEPELSNKMGVWANQLQYKGRRFQKPPPFLHKIRSAHELGLVTAA